MRSKTSLGNPSKKSTHIGISFGIFCSRYISHDIIALNNRRYLCTLYLLYIGGKKKCQKSMKKNPFNSKLYNTNELQNSKSGFYIGLLNDITCMNKNNQNHLFKKHLVHNVINNSKVIMTVKIVKNSVYNQYYGYVCHLNIYETLFSLGKGFFEYAVRKTTYFGCKELHRQSSITLL